jgi:predicted RNA-binding Zn-ribbon protein involved in translation (DUF1610 family)
MARSNGNKRANFEGKFRGSKETWMDDNMDDLREEAVSVTERVKSHALGDDMPCPSCGVSAPIRRDHQNTSWDVECGCGWAAAGSGPSTLRQ